MIQVMQYLDDLITRMAIKCAAISPSGGGSGSDLTVDIDWISVDNDIITSDEDTI